MFLIASTMHVVIDNLGAALREVKLPPAAPATSPWALFLTSGVIAALVSIAFQYYQRNHEQRQVDLAHVQRAIAAAKMTLVGSRAVSEAWDSPMFDSAVCERLMDILLSPEFARATQRFETARLFAMVVPVDALAPLYGANHAKIQEMVAEYNGIVEKTPGDVLRKGQLNAAMVVYKNSIERSAKTTAELLETQSLPILLEIEKQLQSRTPLRKILAGMWRRGT